MTPETSEQRKARKKALKASRNPQSLECIPTSPAESAKKGKKRKRRAEDVDDNQEAGSTSLQAGTVEGPPKKKHKNRTGFADPREDTNLNNQSRKALEYAFTQMNRPSKWKFNKARQNWLIRNIWAPEALPEVYFPLAVKYLAAVQGGSREKLTQTCQSYINGEENAEKKEEEKAINPLTATVAPRSILKPTPGPLIDPSPSSKPVDAANTDTTDPIPSSISAVTLADVRCTRARVLLDILSQSTGV
ncbi:hypothetical protein GALMADRAFT_235499 [Galerina marginata CBS 339.88]|uniref:WKF domain-containing protein n=1 Tax=Galerina marginata (strain CBS 339.88) TaxID=685588 RepID=A0A067TM27_GALM3|nr:hypothetical protein GALMADRAFT_235499 [Galerina marginata CBS 339.88]